MSPVPAALLTERLQAAGAHIIPATSGPLQARCAKDVLEGCAEVLRDAGLYPVFMTAVHTASGYMLHYQFAAWDCPRRVMLAADAGPEGRAASLTPLFPGLEWHEREARDMFGIVFENHPDLRPLLLRDEDRDLYPLRKDPEQLKTPEELGSGDSTHTHGQTP